MKNWKISVELILIIGLVVLVIVVKKLEYVVLMVKVLVVGGVCVLEVILCIECVVDVICVIVKEVFEVIVGVGMVLNLQQLVEVIEVGVQFVISLGLIELLLKVVIEGIIFLILGISIVFELMLGMDYGLKQFKFFLVEVNGGVKVLQVIVGLFFQVCFCLMGGIFLVNYCDYLVLKSVLCIGGFWLVLVDVLEVGDYDCIIKLVCEVVEGVKL